MGVYIAEAQQAKRALQSSRRSLHSSTSAAEASAADASAVAVSAIPERPPSRHTAQRDMLASQVASPHNQQPQPLTSASSADAGTAGAGLAGASGLEPQQQASATADGGSSQEGGVRHEAGLSAPAAPAAPAVPAVRSEGSQTQPAQGSGRQATAGKKQPLQAAALQPSPSAQRLTFARSVQYAPLLTVKASQYQQHCQSYLPCLGGATFRLTQVCALCSESLNLCGAAIRCYHLNDSNPFVSAGLCQMPWSKHTLGPQPTSQRQLPTRSSFPGQLCGDMSAQPPLRCPGSSLGHCCSASAPPATSP